MENIFSCLTKEQLRQINDDRIKSKKKGIRPKSYDKYIRIVMNNYHFSFGEGWTYVERDFF